jgi:uroporphyrinogen decarboxylase
MTTNRERFLRIMNYQPVDRLPVLDLEPLEELVLQRWLKEGLPAGVDHIRFLGMSQLVQTGGVRVQPIPKFAETIVSEEEDYYSQITELGATVRRRRDAPHTFYGHTDFPIKSRDDWKEYRKLLNPADTTQRLHGVLTPGNIRRLNASDDPVGLGFFPYFFRFGFYTMGMEGFLTAFYDDEDLVHEMFAQAAQVLLAGLPLILGQVKVDFAVFCEDLAGKNGPLVSPEIYEKFWAPHQQPILQVLRAAGVPVICLWSAGRFEQLIPAMMTHGFNCTWPVERNSGMNPLELRRTFGRDLRLGGGLSLKSLIDGPDAIDRNIEELMPLIKAGGFIPALDDMVPLECPFAHYRHLIKQLQAIRLE